jgi:hypothetical protein
LQALARNLMPCQQASVINAVANNLISQHNGDTRAPISNQLLFNLFD